MSEIVLDQEKLDNILSGLPFTLNEKQMKFIVGFINGTGHWCLLSPAGGGKSLMMLVLSKYYGDEMIFTSSTGISSENMPEGISSGTTHGVMSLPTKPATDYDYRKVSSKCSKILASSSIVKLIAFDEAFYLNSDSLDVLLRRKTRFDKKTAKRDRRDIRFLFVGDTCQGTTITDKPLKVELSKRHGHHLMFMTDLWENMDITYAMLDKVERQDDRNFKAALDVIRYYEKDRLPKCLEWINKRYGLTPPENSILLAATNKTVSKTNDWYLKNNPNPKQVYQSTQSGIVNKKEIPVGDSFTACVGLRVLTINNQRDGLWQNGSAGVITATYSSGVQVLFDNGSNELVDYHVWENKERYVAKDVVQADGSLKDEMKEEKLGEFCALPLIIGHAVTFSRMQGATIRSPMIVDAEDEGLYTSPYLEDFGTNMVYVGLSRSSSLDLIYLKRKLTIDHIKPCGYSLAFWDFCKESSVI